MGYASLLSESIELRNKEGHVHFWRYSCRGFKGAECRFDIFMDHYFSQSYSILGESRPLQSNRAIYS